MRTKIHESMIIRMSFLSANFARTLLRCSAGRARFLSTINKEIWNSPQVHTKLVENQSKTLHTTQMPQTCSKFLRANVNVEIYIRLRVNSQ